MEPLTQTQERKLWSSLLHGNEHAIKWNEIITAFSGLGLDRQMVALKKIPIEKFLSVISLFEESAKSRTAEIAKHSARIEGITQLKIQMKEQGISIEDIQDVNIGPVIKKKYKKRRDSISVLNFLQLLAEYADNGIVKLKASELAELLDIGVSTVYQRISQLKRKGKVVPLSSGGYQIIGDDIREIHKKHK